jgi:hypothetical protein
MPDRAALDNIKSLYSFSVGRRDTEGCVPSGHGIGYAALGARLWNERLAEATHLHPENGELANAPRPVKYSSNGKLSRPHAVKDR